MEKDNIAGKWNLTESYSDREFENIVCMKHMRFLPCRPCFYRESDHGGHWDSNKAEDILEVRAYQEEARSRSRPGPRSAFPSAARALDEGIPVWLTFFEPVPVWCKAGEEWLSLPVPVWTY